MVESYSSISRISSINSRAGSEYSSDSASYSIPYKRPERIGVIISILSFFYAFLVKAVLSTSLASISLFRSLIQNVISPIDSMRYFCFYSTINLISELKRFPSAL